MTEVVEAIVLDVRLKGRGPAPLPAFVNIDVAVIPVQRDSAGGTDPEKDAVRVRK